MLEPMQSVEMEETPGAGKLWAISNVLSGAISFGSPGGGSQPNAHAASAGGTCSINAGPIKLVIQTTNNGEGKTGTQISTQITSPVTGEVETSGWTLPQPIQLPAPSTGRLVSGNGPADVFIDAEAKGASAIGPPGAFNDAVNGLNSAANILTNPGQIGNWVDGAGRVIMKYPPLDEALHGMTGYISDISKGFVNPDTPGACKPPPICKKRSSAHQVFGLTAQDDGCPPPPPQPPPNNGGLYIDPSGTVHTRGGHPVADARVLLLRSARRRARLRPVARGSAIMSPANRRNPDHSDELGFFGWDVTPGWYQVRASHRGCATGATRRLHVPPPAVGLSIALSCPHLRYARSTVSLRVSRERSVSRVHTLLLTVRVSGHRGHGRAVGIVTLRASRRSLGQVALDARSGTATLVTVVSGRPWLRATYSGDGAYAASRSRAIRPRR